MAMEKSINLVSVRLMREIGMDYTWNYVQRFGFDKSQLPQDLTMALGTAELSPLQVATAYSTFANGGFRVSSYYIDRIEDAAGKTLFQAEPLIACADCGRTAPPLPTATPVHAAPAEGARGAQLSEGVHDGKYLIPAKDLAPQIIRPQVAYLLSDMMADVVRRGTAQRALVLGRDDIAGKTGTTNDQHDAWFSGFNGDLVATVWTGFDADRIARRYRARRPCRAADLDLSSCVRRSPAPRAARYRCRTASSRCAYLRIRVCWRAPTTPRRSWRSSSRATCPRRKTTKVRTTRIR